MIGHHSETAYQWKPFHSSYEFSKPNLPSVSFLEPNLFPDQHDKNVAML